MPVLRTDGASQLCQSDAFAVVVPRSVKVVAAAAQTLEAWLPRRTDRPPHGDSATPSRRFLHQIVNQYSASDIQTGLQVSDCRRGRLGKEFDVFKAGVSRGPGEHVNFDLIEGGGTSDDGMDNRFVKMALLSVRLELAENLGDHVDRLDTAMTKQVSGRFPPSAA